MVALSPIERISTNSSNEGKITDVLIDIIQLPLKKSYSMAGMDYSNVKYHGVLVRVRTADGVEGLGEVFMTPGWYGPDTPLSYVYLIKKVFGPAIIGESVFNISKIIQLMDKLWHLGNNWTKSVLEQALYDAAAKTINRPLVDLLGGKVRDRFPLVGGVGTDSPEEMAKTSRAYVDRGFKTIKLKIGSRENLSLDVDRVRLVREEIGSDILIRVDGNGVYDVHDSIRLIRQIEKYDLDHVEQPIAEWDLEGMARIRKAIDVPLLADESVHTPLDAYRTIKAEAADAIKIKLAKCGGFQKAQEIIAICKAAGVEVILGNGIGTSAAALAELALACANPAVKPAGEFPAPDKLGKDILLHPMKIVEGDAILPTRAGLGSALDYDAFKACRWKC